MATKTALTTIHRGGRFWVQNRLSIMQDKLGACRLSSAVQLYGQTGNPVHQQSRHLATFHILLPQDKRNFLNSQKAEVIKPLQRLQFHSSALSYQKEKSQDEFSKSEGAVTDEKSTAEEEEEEPIIPTKDETGKPLSNWARMKIMMKTYGYVIIPVHWIIAPFWFGSFYYAIKIGVDIEPILSKVGVSDHHIETLKHSKASTAVMAYALYKIFTPLRYTVTLGATEVTIRTLRKRGFIKPTPPKEKTYRQSFKDTVDGMKEKLSKDNKT